MLNRRKLSEVVTMNATIGKFNQENTDLFMISKKLDEGAYRKAFSLEKFYGIPQMLKK